MTWLKFKMLVEDIITLVFYTMSVFVSSKALFTCMVQKHFGKADVWSISALFFQVSIIAYSAYANTVKRNGSSHHLRIAIQWLNTFLSACKICVPVSQLLPLVYGLFPVMQINKRTVVNCTALLKDSCHTLPYKTL